MSDFDSLTLALEGWFDTPMCDLPDALRQRVEQEFLPMPWDNVSADGRRSVALQLDYQHDPATAQDQKFWWDFFERERALVNQIEQWETVATPTASDLAQKETRMAKLQQDLALMGQQQRQARGDYYPERKQFDKKVGNLSAKQNYIAYPKAMQLLAERLVATPEELATWLFFGPKAGGITAYLNANELVSPPKFYFNSGGVDYLSSLMSCWFLAEDIANFQPTERYITGKALIERWSKQPNIQTEAFILAKIKESRLEDFHPTFGGTEASFSGMGSFPPLETGLFALSQIKEIEASDFGNNEIESPTDTKHPGHLNHDLQMQKRANEIAAELTAATKKAPTKNKVAKKLAAELDIPFDTVLRRIRAEWKKKLPFKHQKLPHK